MIDLLLQAANEKAPKSTQKAPKGTQKAQKNTKITSKKMKLRRNSWAFTVLISTQLISTPWYFPALKP